ncbi:hypothetical protein UPYG_G00193130 [Umbra pygmaea]|uniref:Mastermind-like protein 2 n=1 Tax=Umbra pygmaea TaxID=75934 RepID=A0ABD0X2R1_UMBPY
MLSLCPQLQGSLRRKLEGQAPGYSKQNGLSCGPDFKRVHLEGAVSGLGGHGHCSFNAGQSQSLGSGALSLGHTLNRKSTSSSYMMPQGAANSDLFNMTLKEMKKEPIEHVTSCGQTSTEMMVFDFKDEVSSGQIDPELQDLFDELTRSVPPLNDLEFEKMMKQDDTFGLAELERGAATLCSHLDKPIKSEFPSPDFGQTHSGCPQLRPASAGPSFSMPGSTPLNNQKGVSHGPLGLTGPPNRGLPGWPEMSHAEQLKQMAANQNQNPGTSWNTHTSSGSYPQDKLSNPASLGQRMASPQTSIGNQSKGINNCLFKPNGHNGSHHVDMKVLSNKSMLDFSSKAPQQHPNMAGSLSKASSQQQQSSSPAQNQIHTANHYQNPQHSMSGSPHLQSKPLAQRTPPLSQHGPGAGLQFKLAQQRQVPPGPRLPTNGSLGGIPAPPQQRPPAPTPQQNVSGLGTAQVLQRQLARQQHGIKDSEKGGNQDQFNRHLTRPPPDYQHPRGMNQEQGLFTSMSSSQSLSTNGPDQTDLGPMSCHMPNGPGAKMTSQPADRRFVSGSDPHQLQQQYHHSRVGVGAGLGQNKPRFPGPHNGQGNGFGGGGLTSEQHPIRTLLGQQGGGGAGSGQSLGDMMGWPPGAKPPNMGPGSVGVRRLSNTAQNQGGQSQTPLNMASRLYPLGPRHTGPGPPNQVAPDIGMLPLNPALQGSARPGQNLVPLTGHSQSSPEQRAAGGSGTGVFPPPSHNSGGSYLTQSSQAVNRLTFDFLQEGDNTVPGVNTDSDFIDSLLKSGSGNDDWMKDINLDEILGSHS